MDERRGARLVRVAAAGLCSLLAWAVPPGLVLADDSIRLPDPAPTVSERLPGVRVDAPRVRIGLDLEQDGQVRLGGASYRIVDGWSGEPVWPGRAVGEVLVVPEGGRTAGSETVYRVQVGSFRNEAEARSLAEELERGHREPADAVWQASRGVWRVRVGRKPAREQLADLVRALRAEGFSDAWIAGEPRQRREGGRLRLLDSRWEVHPTGTDRLVFVATGRSHLTVDGRSYRGLVEVLLDPYGRLRAVNEIPLESYLRGVVPRELGPAAWPELEALKAQAVAARTYILANLGQYAEDGYDICDTPLCQVYGGESAEHPLTDRAIRETRGEILVYDGQPINAMYTSTAGGYTEDVENVFPEMSGPYLRGVPVAPDPGAIDELIIAVHGRAPGPDGMRWREHAAADLRQLVALVGQGVLPREALDPSWRARSAEPGEIAGWVRSLATSAGKPAPSGPPRAADRLTLLRWWRQALGPRESASALLGPHDAEFLLAVEDRDVLPPRDRVLVASLIAEGIVVPGPSGHLDPRGRPTREEVLGWLARAAERYDALAWRDGILLGREADGSLRLRDGRVERTWPMAGGEPPDLLVRLAGHWQRVSRLEFLAGDEVEWVVSPFTGRLVALAAPERRGVADDRFGHLYRWERVRTRQELERGLEQVAPVGRLRDLEILGRGVSGRVLKLKLTGTGGEAVVEGFRIRRALGLPETLFTLERQHEPDGLIRRVIFSGRGWGHGVGLCQVGAYGMALRGKTYREILTHYYTGAEIVRAAP